MGTNGAGVLHMKDGRFRRVGDGSDIVYSLAPDGAGGLHVGTSAGLKHMAADGTWTLQPTAGLGSSIVNFVAPDREGGVLAAVIGWGIGRLRDGRIEPSWPSAAEISSLHSNCWTRL